MTIRDSRVPRSALATLLLTAACLVSGVPRTMGAQQTRAERSKYRETSTYADVVAFIDSLQARGAKIRVGRLRRSPGRFVGMTMTLRL